MRVLVINPNSNQAVTDGMAVALRPLEIDGGPEIECVTLAEGPFGVETQADVESVTLPLRKLVSENNDADAFVIACYSDPGLQVCREATDKPVFGIQECGVLTALSLGGQFGVIALSSTSIKRHLRYIRQMGVMERLAKERAADLSVADSASGAGTFERLCDVGRDLRDLDGADSIILGCAGMAIHRAALADHLGIPVTDPVQAATSMAIGAVLLRCHSTS
jgi:Asp/Glu/hydantoin racemase